MKKLYVLASMLILASLVLSACGSTPTTQAPAATEEPVMTEAPVVTEAPVTEAPAMDLLATIQARGTLVSFTDPAYPPQSSLKDEPKRTEGTKCADDQKTLGELEGFDVARLIHMAEA